MARPSSHSPGGSKRRGPTPILPLGGVLAAMPFAPLSPGLAQPSPALRQPLPAPPAMPAPALSRPRVMATPPTLQGKQPLKAKPPRIKQAQLPGTRTGLV